MQDKQKRSLFGRLSAECVGQFRKAEGTLFMPASWCLQEGFMHGTAKSVCTKPAQPRKMNYELHLNTPKTWTEANAFCKTKGLTLASILNHPEMMTVYG